MCTLLKYFSYTERSFDIHYRQESAVIYNITRIMLQFDIFIKKNQKNIAVNQQQSNILDRLYQIMFKIIILSQIWVDKYQKLIFEILLLSSPWRAVQGQ